MVVGLWPPEDLKIRAAEDLFLASRLVGTLGFRRAIGLAFDLKNDRALH